MEFHFLSNLYRVPKVSGEWQDNRWQLISIAHHEQFALRWAKKNIKLLRKPDEAQDLEQYVNPESAKQILQQTTF